jgi:hypothetical protein
MSNNRENEDDPKEYIPQYKKLGIKPVDGMNTTNHTGGNVTAKPSQDNPRLPRAVIRQEYANPTHIDGVGGGHIPNSGNNIEQSWFSVDGNIIDDAGLNIDPNQELIDNNDFVTNEALGATRDKKFLTKEDLQKEILNDMEAHKTSALQELKENEYMLLIDGTMLCTGLLEYVQEQANLLVFGEHELCDGTPISIDSLLILKRVKIKVGLFIE